MQIKNEADMRRIATLVLTLVVLSGCDLIGDNLDPNPDPIQSNYEQMDKYPKMGISLDQTNSDLSGEGIVYTRTDTFNVSITGDKYDNSVRFKLERDKDYFYVFDGVIEGEDLVGELSNGSATILYRFVPVDTSD